MADPFSLPEALWAAVHRAAGGGAWPPGSASDFTRFADQAVREGLLPLLFHDATLPPSVRERLEARTALLRLAVARAILVRNALASVARILHDEPFAVLKGADYMTRLYERPELRPMQDVDVLVPRERIDAVCDRLVEGGLVPRAAAAGARAAASYYERPFLLGDVIVEIHHSFLQRSRHRVDYASLWKRVEPAPELGPSAARLAPADAVAYHALALAKDEFTVPLVRYVDLWRMLRRWPDALPVAAGRVREWRAARALYGTLRQAARFFPELGEGETAAIARSLVGPRARAFLDRFVLPPAEEQGRAGVVTRRRQLWRKLWLLDGPRERATFAVAHAAASLSGRRSARAGK
jgi:hypothetical protein